MKSKRMINSRGWSVSRTGAILWTMICAAWFLSNCAGISAPLFEGPVGLQLYSLRNQLDKDVPGTLDEVRSWGIKYVELAGTYKLTPSEFRAQLDAHGLTAVSGHFPYERWRDDPKGVLQDAEKLGLKYVGCAWIPHQGAFDEATCRKAITVFNHVGDLATAHHMIFFYHPHGYEFQPFGSGTLFDLMKRETKTQINPEHVQFEMDIFWIAHAGQDPARLLEKDPEDPDRWGLMHLKDMRKGTKTGLLTGSSKPDNDVALGTGQLDLPGILRAAKEVGVKWYFIEDESSASEKQIPESLRYLREVR